jgi:dGTPase
MSPQVVEAANSLRQFLFERVYARAREEAERARKVVRFLFKHFLEYPEKLPEEYPLRGDSVERKVVDYIAGMTDNYALRLAEEVSPMKRHHLGWSVR